MMLVEFHPNVEVVKASIGQERYASPADESSVDYEALVAILNTCDTRGTRKTLVVGWEDYDIASMVVVEKLKGQENAASRNLLVVWTHPRSRRRGLAKKLIESVNIA